MLGRYPRVLGIANAVVLLVAILSVGQVRYDNQRHDGSGQQTVGFGATEPTSGATGPATSHSPRASQSPGPKHSRPARGGRDARGGHRGSPSASPSDRGHHGQRSQSPTPRATRSSGHEAVPDFGLRTQGVTAKSVLIGLDYNKSGCGGAGALSNQFSASVTGDQEVAIATFVRYINDTGGIRGRTLKYVTVDDGGPNCPERNKSAAIQLAEKHKVFLDVAGLHEVSDLLVPYRIPFYGGRSTRAEQAKQGMGQFQLYQDADSDFLNWAAFGRYYLHADKNKPCFVHPDTSDFNNLEKLMVRAMSKYGLKFGDIIRYADDTGTALQQAGTYSVRMQRKGCKSVWLLANNFLADVFFTQAAALQNWHPIWTWTARTAGIDTTLAGRLMNASEWANSIGLSTAIRPGSSPYEGNCARIYNRYHSGDGQSGSAAVLTACNAILTVSEAMRRAVDRTGVLTGNSLMMGVDAIRGDFAWDAFVPLTFSITKRPFDFTGYDLQTVEHWSRARNVYEFPEFPKYWKVMGPNGSGAVDIRKLLHKTYHPPKR